MSRVILHIDMDAFFAAIEEMDHPELKGKPVVVGANPRQGSGRGVVSTCNYKAREYGIHSAMPISRAYKLCPHAVFVPPRGKRYSQVSARIMALLSDFTPDIQPLSVDEAFMDISSTWKFFGSPEKLAMALKARIHQETGLTASVGIAPNMFVAKIASDLKKPDGLVIVEQGRVQAFLAPLALKRMWGVGPKTLPQLQEFGMHTIGDLAKCDPGWLEKKFGKAGRHFHLLANGQDDRVVSGCDAAKSVSKERTYGSDCNDEEEIRQTLLSLCDDVSRELRKQNYQGRTITLKIRLSDFSTFTRSKTFSYPTNHSSDLYDAIMSLYRYFDRKKSAVRLVGVGVSKFDHPQQIDLFASRESQKHELESLMDLVRDKFGQKAISRASLMNRKNRDE